MGALAARPALLLRGALIALLAWVGISFARTAVSTERQVRWARQAELPPTIWEAEGRSATEFETFLARMAERIPPGSAVLFSPGDGLDYAGREVLFLWAAHARPELDWQFDLDFPASRPPSFWVAFDSERPARDAGWELIGGEARRGVYRPRR